MGKKNCKNKKIVSTIWKKTVGPFLTVVWEWIVKALKFGGKLAVRLIGLTVFGAVIILPFLHDCIDHTLAQWLWYPASVGYIVFAIFDLCIRKEPSFKTPIFEYFSKVGTAMLLPFMASVFVFNYYDIEHIWLWVIFAMIAIAAPIFFFSFYLFDIKHNNRTEEQRKNGAVNIFKYILLYWLYDLFYMAIFNQWLVLTYVFGIIAVVVIFYNLTKTFLNGAKALQMFLPFDLLFGIGLSVYLIYIIPDDDLQNVILTITAAVIGGLLTLVGVAWTIKKGDADRQADLQRVEEERREEERKKHIPYVRISFEKELPPMAVDAGITSGLNLKKAENRELLEGYTYYAVSISNFVIKNVSGGNIVLMGVIVHGEYHRFLRTEIMEPSICCQIQTTNNWSVPAAKPETSIWLIVKDVLGNHYKIECPVSYKFNSNVIGIQTTVDGIELTALDYTYVVNTMGLPELITKDDIQLYDPI